VFDVGQTAKGVPFMVMEHLVGNDLDDELHRRSQLDVQEAVDYVLQAADAIAAAHALGIVHRDLKPANLFLTVRADGSRRVKVLDFGISRAHGDDAPISTKHTSSLGTPAYMSPEQVRAALDVDGRADIWALGAILYELVTGQMAFVGETVKDVLDMVLSDDPCPMTRLRRDVPSGLEAVIMQCLARDRAQRWPTAGALARALAPFGSPGMVGQLASLQRDIGSLSPVRMASAPSVVPVVAPIGGRASENALGRRPHPTLPDPDEVRARDEIVLAHSRQRARVRLARASALVAAGACLVAVMTVLAVKSARVGASEAAEPPPAAAGATGVAMAGDASGLAASDAPSPSPPSSAATPGSVQSARIDERGARRTVKPAARASGTPARPATGE
jgi:serine/threonine-protein kinase